MIPNYDDFMLESLLSDLILEAKIIFASDFLSIIKKLAKNDNEIAKKILNLNSTEVDIDHNYIELSDDKNDSITFISDKRFISNNKKVKYKVINNGHLYSSWPSMKQQYGITTENDISCSLNNFDTGFIIDTFRHPNSGEEVTIFSRESDNGRCLIGMRGLQEIGVVGTRSEMKVGRFVKKILDAAGISSTSKEIEEFVNKFKSEIDASKDVFYNFRLLSGEDIRGAYLGNNYSQNYGPLANSCMRYEECQEFLDIYVNNPDKVKLLAYFDRSDKILGRALVWKLDEPDITFMDRIYVSNDSDVELFKKYAKDKNWACKSTQNSGIRTPIENYTEQRPVLKTKLNNFKFGSYPYLDTLVFMTRDGIIHNDRTINSYCMFRDTEGSDYFCGDCEGLHEWDCDECNGRGKWTCDECGGTGEEDDQPCSYCKGTRYIDCTLCGGSGTVTCDNCSNIVR